MRLEIDRADPERPSRANLAKALRALRPGSKTTWLALVDEERGFVQVAGGRITCVLERGEPGGQVFRAYSDDPSMIEDHTKNLSVEDGKVPVEPDEWLDLARVELVCAAFLEGKDPREVPGLSWREVKGFR